MSRKTIALVAAFMVSSTLAFAQSSQGKAGSENGPASNSVNTTDGMKQDAAGTKMKTGTTGSTKDASTQGAGTAGAVQKKGDATTPGGTMKQQ